MTEYRKIVYPPFISEGTAGLSYLEDPVWVDGVNHYLVNNACNVDDFAVGELVPGYGYRKPDDQDCDWCFEDYTHSTQWNERSLYYADYEYDYSVAGLHYGTRPFTLSNVSWNEFMTYYNRCLDNGYQYDWFGDGYEGRLVNFPTSVDRYGDGVPRGTAIGEQNHWRITQLRAVLGYSPNSYNEWRNPDSHKCHWLQTYLAGSSEHRIQHPYKSGWELIKYEAGLETLYSSSYWSWVVRSGNLSYPQSITRNYEWEFMTYVAQYFRKTKLFLLYPKIDYQHWSVFEDSAPLDTFDVFDFEREGLDSLGQPAKSKFYTRHYAYRRRKTF